MLTSFWLTANEAGGLARDTLLDLPFVWLPVVDYSGDHAIDWLYAYGVLPHFPFRGGY
jgi:hypothetical protein